MKLQLLPLGRSTRRAGLIAVAVQNDTFVSKALGHMVRQQPHEGQYHQI